MVSSTERFYDFNKEVGGKVLLYKGGSLGEMLESDMRLQHRNDFHDDMDTMLQINSYVKYAKLGNPGSFCVEVYRRDDESHLFEAPYLYLVDIDLNGHHQHVFVENYPLLLQLLQNLAPLASIEIVVGRSC